MHRSGEQHVLGVVIGAVAQFRRASVKRRLMILAMKWHHSPPNLLNRRGACPPQGVEKIVVAVWVATPWLLGVYTQAKHPVCCQADVSRGEYRDSE